MFPTAPIHTPRLTLRAPRAHDVAPLAALLAAPSVARWWHGYDEARVRADLFDDDDTLTVFVVEHGDAVAGLIQFGEELDPNYRHASVDLFLGEPWHGRGLGPEAIAAIVAHLIDVRGHHRVVIDPAADNVRAIRAYEKVGFRRVGVLRDYERGPDGTWHDGLLMDLLARDLRPPR